MLELGGKVISLSDSGGTWLQEEGLSKEAVDAIDDIKVVKKGRLHEYKGEGGEWCLISSDSSAEIPSLSSTGFCDVQEIFGS